jgi:transcription termination factor Rho
MEAESNAEPTELPGSEYFNEGAKVLELDRLHRLSHSVLLELTRQFNLRASHERTRHQLIFDLLKAYSSRGVQLIGEGMLEMTNEHYGFLRWERYNFTPCPEDVHVSAALLKKHGIRAGNKVRGYISGPKEKEKFMTMDEVISIEGIPIEIWTEPKHFDQLTALFPDRRILLENSKTRSVSASGRSDSASGTRPTRFDRCSTPDGKDDPVEGYCAGDSREFAGYPLDFIAGR